MPTKAQLIQEIEVAHSTIAELTTEVAAKDEELAEISTISDNFVSRLAEMADENYDTSCALADAEAYLAELQDSLEPRGFFNGTLVAVVDPIRLGTLLMRISKALDETD